MIVRNRPFAFVRPKESSQPVSSPMQRRSNTDGTKFQYGWNQVPVWMEPSSNTDGTKFQYGWNQVPVRMEPGSSRDGTKFQYGGNGSFTDIHIL